LKGRIKMTVSSLKSQRERLSLGERPIPESYLCDMSESDYRKMYGESCKMGVLYALHKFTPKRMLLMSEIGEIVGWKRCSVKNNLIGKSGLAKSGILRTSIKKFAFPKGVRRRNGSVYYYLNNPSFSELSYDELVKLYLNTSIVRNCANNCEVEILNICNELFPGQFDLTAVRTLKNRLHGKYPDLRHNEYPILIEHAGSWHHRKKYEEKRVGHWNKHGYYCLVIWDYNEKDRNKVKNQIKEFVENAIQNIQQLAI